MARSGDFESALEKQVSEVVTETPLNALEKVPVFFGDQSVAIV